MTDGTSAWLHHERPHLVTVLAPQRRSAPQMTPNTDAVHVAGPDGVLCPDSPCDGQPEGTKGMCYFLLEPDVMDMRVQVTCFRTVRDVLDGNR